MSAVTYKVEFWTRASGKNRKHRCRYYSMAEGMLRAGARWEAKGSDYWCRYWNGLSTWISAPKSQLSTITPPRPAPARGKRIPAQVYSIFGQCEAVAAEMMLRDGRATLRISVADIPETALYNKEGKPALFAILIPGDQLKTFERLCKEIRS